MFIPGKMRLAVVALYLSSSARFVLSVSTPSPTPENSGCWKMWYCTGNSDATAYYCAGAGETPCSFANVGCDSPSADGCTPVLGEVSGGTCEDMVGPWGAEYKAGIYYCDVDACGAEVCATLESNQGCYKSWSCTGETADSAYYCDGVGVTPCSFAYYACDSAEYSESCTPVLGEVSGGTCEDMVGPWGAEYTAGEYYCDADTYTHCAEVCGSESDDDDDNVCFSGDSTVELASGITKPMAELQVGDSILSVNSAGKFSYSDVIFLPHGANSKVVDFVGVTTESGKLVKTTPSHLLKACDGSLVQAKYASCLRTIHGNEVVTAVEALTSEGIYSAVTLENEFLVVDGVVASPFAMAHSLVNAYYNIHRAVYTAFPSLTKMPAILSANSLLAASAVAAMNAVSVSEK